MAWAVREAVVLPRQDRPRAEADAAYTGQSNLAGVWFAVAAGYQKQQIDRNAEALTAQQRVVRAYDEKLTGLLTGAAP